MTKNYFVRVVRRLIESLFCPMQFAVFVRNGKKEISSYMYCISCNGHSVYNTTEDFLYQLSLLFNYLLSNWYHINYQLIEYCYRFYQPLISFVLTLEDRKGHNFVLTFSFKSHKAIDCEEKKYQPHFRSFEPFSLSDTVIRIDLRSHIKKLYKPVFPKSCRIFCYFF